MNQPFSPEQITICHWSAAPRLAVPLNPHLSSPCPAASYWIQKSPWVVSRMSSKVKIHENMQHKDNEEDPAAVLCSYKGYFPNNSLLWMQNSHVLTWISSFNSIELMRILISKKTYNCLNCHWEIASLTSSATFSSSFYKGDNKLNKRKGSYQIWLFDLCLIMVLLYHWVEKSTDFHR